MTTQPEALRLAERLLEIAKYSGSEYWDDLDAAAAELRRLHEASQELRKALKLCLDGLLTYAPDYMHGLPKEKYIKMCSEALAKEEGRA